VASCLKKKLNGFFGSNVFYKQCRSKIQWTQNGERNLTSDGAIAKYMGYTQSGVGVQLLQIYRGQQRNIKGRGAKQTKGRS
jgi:hypothetical protein